jgi:abhydrolase domain-containing protein 12
LVDRFEGSLNFRLLKESRDARLVLYLHGTSGTMASGWRPASYRSLYAADPINTHILTFDFRGYGQSSGTPTEEGLITDALSIADWAMNTAGIPPDRIVIFGQSLGSAVAIALVHRLAEREPRIHFAGLVVTASFSDVGELTATYRIGGVVPVLSPVARVPPLCRYFTSQLHSRWDNVRRLGEFIAMADRHHVTLLHAEDDSDIPMEHSVRLFREAVRVADGGKNATGAGLDAAQLRRVEDMTARHGEGGSVTVWPARKGDITLQVLRYGVHDKVLSFPVTGLAVHKAFASVGI